MINEKIREFRGVEGLVAAEVIIDNAETYETGDVFDVAAAAEISKDVETSTDAKYYNNIAAIVIESEGADTINIEASVLSLEVLSRLTGKVYNKKIGAFIDTQRESKYFAIGYKTNATDGTSRYVWRHKGSFEIPAESSSTMNAGTDSSGQSLTFTGISTAHAFAGADNKPAKGIVIEDSNTNVDLTDFFKKAQTADTLKIPEDTESDTQLRTGTVKPRTRAGDQ